MKANSLTASVFAGVSLIALNALYWVGRELNWYSDLTPFALAVAAAWLLPVPLLASLLRVAGERQPVTLAFMWSSGTFCGVACTAPFFTMPWLDIFVVVPIFVSLLVASICLWLRVEAR